MLSYTNRSFAAKINFYLLLPLFLLGGGSFAVFHHYATAYIEKQTYLKLDHSAEQINLKVTRLLKTIEKIPENLSWIFSDYVKEPDSVFSITRQVVKNNYEIFGCAIAFEPYYFPEKGFSFAPYSYMHGDTVYTTEIAPKYDYYHKNWYCISKELNTSRWSRPYHDLSSPDIITSTYSVPLHGPDKKVIGIFSVDLSMNWLTQLIDSIKPYKDSYSIIVNSHGKYILHPQEKTFFEEENNVLQVAAQMEDSSVLHILNHLLRGEKGNGTFYDQSIKYYIYYTPIQGTEWYMATVFPYAHIFEGLRYFNRFLIVFFLLFMGLIILISTTTIQNLTQPLKNFAFSAHSIAEGNFQTSLPAIRSNDEMQELHHAFSEMQEKLAVYMHNLEITTAAKEKIESELRIAHDIQMSMLRKTFPPFPERKEIDLYAVLYPARQVGGDLYDFFIRDNQLYFAIGDVSGKGIPASLLMSFTISLLRSFSTAYNSPAQILRQLNNSITACNETEMFITLFIGMLDLKTGLIKYSNAGHTPPVLTYPDKTVAFFDISPELPVGILPNHDYPEYTYQFTSGSGILLYTDGVTDAENEQQEFYTKTRLLEIIRRHHHLHPQEFIETILEDIRRHIKSHPLSDDLSMLTFIYGKEWNIKNS